MSMSLIRRFALATAAVVTVAVGLVPAAPAQAAGLPGSIVGHLTDGGAPAAAEVMLHEVNGDIVTFSSVDATGAFSFTGVLPGSYKVSFTTNGYFQQYYPQTLELDQAELVVVTAGAQTVVNATLLPHGSLGGHILTTGGEPAAGVSVYAIDAAGRTLGAGSTEADGTYTIGKLPVGSYRLSITRDGATTEWADGKRSAEVATTVSVTAGQQATLNSTLLPRGVISGHLSGTSISGARVFVVDAATGAEFAERSLGSNGSFQVTAVAGAYKLKFRLSNGNVQWSNRKSGFADADVVTVTADQETVVEEQLLATGTISGSLLLSSGQPARAAKVTISSASGASIETLTSASGTFTASVLPGVYRVRFQTAAQIQWAFGQTSAEEATPITVVSGQTSQVKERMLPGGSIAVTATDTRTGAAVMSFCALAVDRSVPGAQTVSACTTTGTATVTGLGTGTYKVEVGSPPSDDDYPGEELSGVQVVAGQTTALAVAMRPYGVITVTAKDAVTGAALTTFCASLQIDGSDQRCTDSGAVVFGRIQSTSYYLTVFPDGDYLDTEFQELTGQLSEVRTINVALNRGATISVLAKDATTGAPVENACVELVRVDQPSRFGTGPTSCTDGNGTVVVRPVQPDQEYNIFVWARDGVHGHQWMAANKGVGIQADAKVIKAKSGKTVEATIKLDLPGTIAGVVTDKATGQPVRGSVGVSSYTDSFGVVEPTVISDEDGHYAITNLGPYKWTLFFRAHGYAAQWSGKEPSRLDAKGIKVVAGQVTVHDTKLTKGTAVSITATLPNGTPVVPYISVEIYNADTHDLIVSGSSYSTDPFVTPVLGPQKVRIWYLVSPPTGYSYSGWFNGAVDFDHAKKVNIPDSGTKNLNLTINPA